MNKGFTLMEIMIALVICGVLTTIAVPSYQKAVQNAKDKEACVALNLIKAAENVQYQENLTAVKCSSNSDCNAKLGLNLPTGSSRAWNYAVEDASGKSFSIRAYLVSNPSYFWTLRYNTEKPVFQGSIPK